MRSRPGKRARARSVASAIPSTPATTVAMVATWIDRKSGAQSIGCVLLRRRLPWEGESEAAHDGAPLGTVHEGGKARAALGVLAAFAHHQRLIQRIVERFVDEHVGHVVHGHRKRQRADAGFGVSAPYELKHPE